MCFTFTPSKEFEELKASGVKNPEAYMLRHRRHNGQYQGCFSKSHWGKRRVSDKWDVLVQQAPNLSKQVSEVPNVLRPVLGIKAHQLKLLLSLLLLLLFFFEPASIYIYILVMLLLPNGFLYVNSTCMRKSGML